MPGMSLSNQKQTDKKTSALFKSASSGEKSAPEEIAESLFPHRVRHIPWKRLFDIIFSAAVLLLASPLMLVITIMIRLTSKGRAIYSHERIGRGGRPFACYKFRTMYLDAEERLSEILERDTALKKEWLESRKLKCDPRVTPIGAILRKTSLDELPQFFNVLIGDLAVVGPRPVVLDELKEHFGHKAVKILTVRPGITGIWQVSGRSDTSYKTRVLLDEIYVDSCSFSLDVSLILKTIPKMVSTKGAY
ncbi:sugar transferase [Estrella lausannensis]|uniref:Putative undecaprenyl-phosphate galactose phosphotransferase n=1 Tax=Estrella lausannensis TaxID=483423 RepID=A0A0H5DPY4_9BACT|nr:sugar transferase [Estrella lausannensis]CRX38083.1 Putative undecaprenyl-phosphate galactose phosphotransferase [Estrella lausannensis]